MISLYAAAARSSPDYRYHVRHNAPPKTRRLEKLAAAIANGGATEKTRTVDSLQGPAISSPGCRPTPGPATSRPSAAA